ncbi:hypothetical protein [Neptunicella sp. SCSIO 80796]|uniref:hypothetical protein n=1 Tax=Neptunicella plasticusilytica TaxID=3117012 RepID=UPI003A4E3DE5
MRNYLTIILCLCTLPCSAKQLSFFREEQDSQIQFHYVWQDREQQTHQLDVKFDKGVFFDAFRTFKLYRPEVANRYSMMAMRKQASQIDARDANIKVSQSGDNISLSIRSRHPDNIPKWQQQFQQIQRDSFNQYLADNYYIEFENALRQTGVKPDHVKFAQQSQELLKPLVESFNKLSGDKPDKRKTIELVLSWVQSIPYDLLEDRLNSNGSGYSPPNKLIADNKGDCDSKAVLTAALLHGLFPDMPIVYIFLPEHALLGISIKHTKEESVFMYDGKDYFYLEPTGPALFEIGEISAESQRAIGNNQHQFEPVIF